MLQDLIDTFEELKKYAFIIDRGSKGSIIIKFRNDNFYHLVGLHKTNIDMFIPTHIRTKDKKYKYIKKNVAKFNNILENQIKEKDSLIFRISTFQNILDLLNGNNNTILYNLKEKNPNSLYNGDFGLLKIYEQLYCLLGLKCESINGNIISCAPQSWMASNRINKLIEYKHPIFMQQISKVPISAYNDDYCCTT